MVIIEINSKYLIYAAKVKRKKKNKEIDFGGMVQCKCFIYAESNVVFREDEALKY